MNPYEWEVQGGSITGRDHLRSGKNNQDAWLIVREPGYTLALVADGCGSGHHSELGAWWAVHNLTAILHKFLHLNILNLEGSPKDSWIFRKLGETLTWRLRDQLTSENPYVLEPDPELSRNYFLDRLLGDYLFTLMGMLILPEYSYLFGLGDGVAYVNGAPLILEYPGNRPPYLAYSLAPTLRHDFKAEDLELQAGDAGLYVITNQHIQVLKIQ